MDFNYKEEHQMLNETLDKFFRERYSDAIREDNFESTSGYNQSIWNELCELGILGALVSEEHGGFGGTGDDIQIVFQALGNALATEPFLAAGILGLRTASELGLNDLVEDCIMGQKQITLAHYEPESRYAINNVQTQAVKSENGYQLVGRKSMVYGAVNCEKYFVTAKLESSSDKVAIFLLDKSLQNIRCTHHNLVDGSRASEIIFDHTQVSENCLIIQDGLSIIESVISLANLALASEALGIMKKMQDMTIEYMKDRKQFGRAISSFQALQHRAVDMVIDIELFDAAVIKAASTIVSDFQNSIDCQKAIASAKYLVGKTGQLIAEESIQLHGGIGMTWEYSLGHYAKRLTMIDHQFGDSEYQLDKYVELSDYKT